MAGEQQDLAGAALLCQPVQGGGQPLVVKVGQGIVQDQGRGLIPGQHHPADGQPHRQVQLISRTLTQQGQGPGHGVPGGLGAEGQVPVQQHLVVPAAGDGGENPGRFRPQGRGKPGLQDGVGLGQGLHGQGNGVVLRLEGLQPPGALVPLGL